MREIPEEQAAIYDDLAIVGEELHRLVGLLAVYPPEVAAVVAATALRPVVGPKAARRLVGFISNEVKARRFREAQEAAKRPPVAENAPHPGVPF